MTSPLPKPAALSSTGPSSSPSSLSSSSNIKSKIPPFIYGSAWKGPMTETLVIEALKSGFVAVDTAAQPRHYQEQLVGLALRQVLNEKSLEREDVFIQTKYTPIDGQDLGTAPYNANDSIADQVRASVNSSLINLNTGEDDDHYIDCVLLHSPLDTVKDTLAAWNALEEFVPHRIRHLGISNINGNNLDILYDLVRIKPAVIQNRFHPRTQFDRDVRKLCVKKNMVYQAFGVLTANAALLRSAPVLTVATELAIEKEPALYCLVLGLDNVIVLNGTTDFRKMIADINALKKCSAWSTEAKNRQTWTDALISFKSLINDELS